MNKEAHEKSVTSTMGYRADKNNKKVLSQFVHHLFLKFLKSLLDHYRFHSNTPSALHL